MIRASACLSRHMLATIKESLIMVNTAIAVLFNAPQQPIFLLLNLHQKSWGKLNARLMVVEKHYARRLDVCVWVWNRIWLALIHSLSIALSFIDMCLHLHFTFPFTYFIVGSVRTAVRIILPKDATLVRFFIFALASHAPIAVKRINNDARAVYIRNAICGCHRSSSAQSTPHLNSKCRCMVFRPLEIDCIFHNIRDACAAYMNCSPIRMDQQNPSTIWDEWKSFLA